MGQTGNASSGRSVRGRRDVEPEVVGESPANGATEVRIGKDLRHTADLERRHPTKIDRADLVDEHQPVPCLARLSHRNWDLARVFRGAARDGAHGGCP